MYTLSNRSKERLEVGTFDAATFSSTSYNRGWITVQYIA